MAHCYCGHQFGNFAGQLGDGRAISLGEIEAPVASASAAAVDETPGKGLMHVQTWEEIDWRTYKSSTKPQQRWELQLKGAGPTVYSRGSDGRAVVRSSVREFLCSEHMHALGIPTTRAATLVVSTDTPAGELQTAGGASAGASVNEAADSASSLPRTTVVRDMFYDGNPKHETCAVVLRIARCFFRLGSFQISVKADPTTGRSGPSSEISPSPVISLLRYIVKTYYPDIGTAATIQDMARGLVLRVAERTARLAAMWQSVGFCHGVLNTDNISILGVTIDYGPFGFMEHFNADHICNASDNTGRYSYENQPAMCRFDLKRFAEALFHEAELDVSEAKQLLDVHFDQEYAQAYDALMRWKLGLLSDIEQNWLEGTSVDKTSVSVPLAAIAARAWAWSVNDGPSSDVGRNLQLDAEARSSVESLLETMQATGSDFTNVFRTLSLVRVKNNASNDASDIAKQLASHASNAEHMREAHRPSLSRERLQSLRAAADQIGPVMFERAVGVPVSQLEVELARHDEFDRKYASLTDETKSLEDRSRWQQWLQAYSTLVDKWYAGSQSSNPQENRQIAMNNIANPRVVLRNWIAQYAVDACEKAAESGQTEVPELNSVLNSLLRPFDDAPIAFAVETEPDHDHESPSIADTDVQLNHVHLPVVVDLPRFDRVAVGEPLCVS